MGGEWVRKGKRKKRNEQKKKKKMGKLGKIASDKLITAEEEKVNKK